MRLLRGSQKTKAETGYFLMSDCSDYRSVPNTENQEEKIKAVQRAFLAAMLHPNDTAIEKLRQSLYELTENS